LNVQELRKELGFKQYSAVVAVTKTYSSIRSLACCNPEALSTKGQYSEVASRRKCHKVLTFHFNEKSIRLKLKFGDIAVGIIACFSESPFSLDSMLTLDTACILASFDPSSSCC
uniref:tRNA_edit domain-containing protein n=1 Tax=Rodentolepis nana TaxID=102285 RepID=A0A0R3TEX9_RODNA